MHLTYKPPDESLKIETKPLRGSRWKNRLNAREILNMTIRNIEDLAKEFGTSVEHLERMIYKYTDCGAWIHWTDKTVQLGSIVEGSDYEVTATALEFPFEMEEFNDTLQWVEDEASEAWCEAHDFDEESDE